MLETLLQTPSIADSERVIYPGVIEYENELDRIENGIPLHKEVVDWFDNISKTMSVDRLKIF